MAPTVLKNHPCLANVAKVSQYSPVFSAGDEEAIDAHHEGVQPQSQHAPGGGEKVPRPKSKLKISYGDFM